MRQLPFETRLLKGVARLTPWLAPFPSAYFVARASMQHLALPLVVAVVAAAIIETLGLSSVHTWLLLVEWNQRRRHSDPPAPAGFALALAGVYYVATLGLTVLLEVRPQLAAFAPALFPALAIVGAFNLVLLAQQEAREVQQAVAREQRRAGRSGGQMTAKPDRSARLEAGERAERLERLVDFYAQHPGAPYSQAALAVGRSKAWVVQAAHELLDGGRLVRGEQGTIRVHGSGKRE